MLHKFYFANIMRENAQGELEITGSKIIGIWFWQNPVCAYRKLMSSGGLPIDMRRIK